MEKRKIKEKRKEGRKEGRDGRDGRRIDRLILVFVRVRKEPTLPEEGNTLTVKLD